MKTQSKLQLSEGELAVLDASQIEQVSGGAGFSSAYIPPGRIGIPVDDLFGGFVHGKLPGGGFPIGVVLTPVQIAF